MIRLLLSSVGPDECDIDFALITMTPEKAAWWVNIIYPKIKALKGEVGPDFLGTTFHDYDPEFLRVKLGEYCKVLPDEILDEITNTQEAELPDNLFFEGEPLIERVNMSSLMAHVDEDGIYWVGREKFVEEYVIETPKIAWERIQTRAVFSLPSHANETRKHCWRCGHKTQEIKLFSSKICECPICKI